MTEIWITGMDVQAGVPLNAKWIPIAQSATLVIPKKNYAVYVLSIAIARKALSAITVNV